MSRWCSLMCVLASLLVHLVGLVLMLWLVPHDTVPPAIVLDLSEVIVNKDDIRGTGNPGLTSSPGPPTAARAKLGDYRLASPSGAVLAESPGREPSKPGAPPHTAGLISAPTPSRAEKLARSDRHEASLALPGGLSGGGVASPGNQEEQLGSGDHPVGSAFEPQAPGTQAQASSGRPAGGDGGQELGLAVSRGGQGGLGAEYGSYLARIRQRIQESLEYPLAARRRGLTGTVHMEIVIRPDGAVRQVSVLHSSSHRILDEAALDAVRRLPPLPFPAGLPPRALSVRLPVVFELW